MPDPTIPALVESIALQDAEAPVAWFVEIPIAVPEWRANRISANDREARPVVVRKNKFWRTLAEVAATYEAAPKLARGRVMVVFRFPSGAFQREVSNLQPTVKAIVDGLVDAHVFPEDRDEIVFGQDARRDPVRGPLRVLVIVFGRP